MFEINKITTNCELRDIILSGEFDNPIQVKNNEHICKNGTIYDYSSITDMSFMFDSCRPFTTIPLFDTSNVTDMCSMFQYCYNLTEIPQLNISNVSNITDIFYECSSLTKIKQITFFYQKDKILLRNLEQKPELFSEIKLNQLLEIKTGTKKNYFIW
jgi:surface protein